MNLTASQGSSLLRLASSLPKGSEERKGILRILQAYGRQWPDRWELDRRAKARWLRDMASQARFTFEDDISKMLWEEHLIGQISDGMWENSNNNGWEFWGEIPTSVGGQTALKGRIPDGILFGFNFIKEIVPITGDEMLEDAQKIDPNFTMGDVIRSIQKIQKAMRAAKRGLTPDEMPTRGQGKFQDAPDETGQALVRSRALFVGSKLAETKAKPFGESFLYASKDGRAGKFHYFVIFQDDNRRYVPVSVYGNTAKPNGFKAVKLTSGPVYSIRDAEEAIRKKAKGKVSRGYDPSPLDGLQREIRIL